MYVLFSPFPSWCVLLEDGEKEESGDSVFPLISRSRSRLFRDRSLLIQAYRDSPCPASQMFECDANYIFDIKGRLAWDRDYLDFIRENICPYCGKLL